MLVDVYVSPQESTMYEFALVTLNCETAGFSSTVNIDFTSLLDKCNIPNTMSIDFLFISTIIYCIDKLIPRSCSIDNWTRKIDVEIPVNNSYLWNQNRNTFNKAISFLTGDLWNISFRNLETNLIRIKKDRYQLSLNESKPEFVSLFSGGLDSLIGAIDLLESKPEAALVFVGHYDPAVGGPKSDQKLLIKELKKYYGNRTKFVQVKAGQNPAGNEGSFRSRSILFLGLGIYVASAIGEKVNLFIPENGNIALNVPLTPSRRSSCSTRTAHPFFLKTINYLLKSIGIKNLIINPYEFKTKGECVAQCKNSELLKYIFTYSVSCAKSHHRRTWIRRSARQCGRCMPCIYRRAALHKIDLDTEIFGRDICSGEVDLDLKEKIANDFRAYVSFMSNDPTVKEISDLLLANGHLDISKLSDYGDVIFRSMEEIRCLLRDKGTPSLKQQINILRN